MRPADAGRVAALTGELGYPVDEAEMEQRITALLARPDDHALLVAIDAEDRPIGWLHVETSRTLETGPMANVAGLVVGESARSGGIGHTLLAAGEAWARVRDLPTIQVRSRTSRERAHQFYEREGYEQVKISAVFRKRLVG